VATEQRPGNSEDTLEETGIGRSIELRPGGHLGGSDPLEPPVDADFPSFRRLIFYSVLGGLCPLLPDPAGEARACAAVCRRMVVELGRSRGLELVAEEVRLLAECGEESPPARPNGLAAALGRTATALRWRPLYRLARRLALPDGVRRAVETFDQGYLLLHAAGLEAAEMHLPERTGTQVRQVRAAIAGTVRDADDRPLRREIGHLFQSQRALLLRAAERLSGYFAGFERGAAGRSAELAPGSGAVRAIEGLLGGLVDHLAVTLWENREYLADLERAFEANLTRRRAGSTA